MMPRRQSYRVPHGGLVDRTNPIAFTFDGVELDGLAGDTLASALLANGRKLVGRSFKYHRPRGILTAGTEEPNALVELRAGARREPNTRATSVELYDGLIAESQNRFPSLRFDVMAANGLLSSVLGAGFYYKTFKWPPAFWERVYEPLIRKAAGLGRPPEMPDPDRYDRATAHCDVLIVGAGPAGLSAALAAGRSGARVILAETDFTIGGRLLGDVETIDGRPADVWLRATQEELGSLENVRVMRRTSVFGAYDHGVFGALERVGDHVLVPQRHQPRQRFWKIIARRTVVTTGATERPIVFSGNDRPGVMMASAVRTYLKRFATLTGKKITIFTNNDDAWRTARALSQAGVEIAAIVDSRPSTSERFQASVNCEYRLLSGVVVEAQGGAGGVRRVGVQLYGGGTQVVETDCLAMSGGWNPNVALTSHLGHKPRWDAKIAAFVPEELQPHMSIAGAASGAMTLDGCLSMGFERGMAAARALGHSKPSGLPARAEHTEYSISPLWHVGATKMAFVDFQNDVTADDIALAHREGYDSVELAKRYTTLGMATDQGKTSNVTGLAILAALAQRSIPETGTTVFRPPVEPVAIGAIAGGHTGRHLKPTRLPPSHVWAKEAGASFVESGLWLRAQWYARPGETHWLESCNREVLAVRNAVGVCDVSTLGKIDVQGPDAAKFLDRLYCNSLANLPVGRARYGLMLREDGFVMDDGTISRLGREHFIVTTTTANAGKVMQHLEFARQVLWRELDVQTASVSEQWAQFSIAGPRSLDVVQSVVDKKQDVMPEALPFMGVAVTSVLGGIPARIFRISYSGERAYEIAVPSLHGEAFVRAVMERGRAFGITPYGVEALNVLRIEKGHVAGGELNGTTTARDLGLAKLFSRKKDFIGRVMAERPAMLDPNRWHIAGFRPVDPTLSLRAGAHFVPMGRKPTGDDDQGYMTSVCYSPTLGHSIGLGLIERGGWRHGEYVRAYDPIRNGDVIVEICDPVFYDRDGERQRG